MYTLNSIDWSDDDRLIGRRYSPGQDGKWFAQTITKSVFHVLAVKSLGAGFHQQAECRF
jgi:hypothetical protein